MFLFAETIEIKNENKQGIEDTLLVDFVQFVFPHARQ